MHSGRRQYYRRERPRTPRLPGGSPEEVTGTCSTSKPGKVGVFSNESNLTTVAMHEVDKDGLYKTPEKIDAVVNAPRPENVQQLCSFFGLVD